jgi:hypothetical protein
MSRTIVIPTLNNAIQDFELLFSAQQDALECNRDLIFDFSHCQVFPHYAIAFLGGLVRSIESYGRHVTIDWDTTSNEIFTNLDRNGFYTCHSRNGKGGNGKAIPYQEYLKRDTDGFITYLRDLWLGRSLVPIDPDMQLEVIAKVVEIYVNAFEHADSTVGVFVCGQHYHHQGELNLTLVDFGLGIPHKIRTHLSQHLMEAREAIKWALARGNSTGNENVPRGIGLDTLISFVRENDGRLEIFSDNGYSRSSRDELFCVKYPKAFCGTLINISLKCANLQYHKQLEINTTRLWEY